MTQIVGEAPDATTYLVRGVDEAGWSSSPLSPRRPGAAA